MPVQPLLRFRQIHRYRNLTCGLQCIRYQSDQQRIEIAGTDFTQISVAQRDALFNTSTSATGSFCLIYSTAETGSGSPSGTRGFDQTLSVDYKNRKIQLSGIVDATGTSYFDGDTRQFNYSSELIYPDIQSGTTSVSEATNSPRSDGSFSMNNGDGDDVQFDVTDEIGFVIDSGTGKAAVINSAVNLMLENPSGYNDNTRDMVQPAWRVLEPQ